MEKSLVEQIKEINHRKLEFWDKHSKTLKNEIDNGLNLSEGKVFKTIGYTFEAYTKKLLKKHEDNYLLEKVIDPSYGNPSTIDGYSMSTLRCLEYMKHLEKYVNVNEINSVTDFGSGYGNFCRVWKIFNPNVKYYNVDLEEMLDLQKDYIRNTVENKENIYYITHNQLDQVDTNKSLFLAAYSLSECSLDVRKEVEPFLKKYDYIMIIYNEMFNNEYDNVKYFNDIKKTALNTHECSITFDKESAKWWLTCKKKPNMRDPNDLLTHKRFDVVMKYMYASNLSSDYYKNQYKEHIRVWNNFYEKMPQKNTFEDFDNAFKSIINNTVDEPVPVNSEGHIANGAHRLAAALYHQRPINTRDTNSDENYPILADYTVFAEKGLPKHMLQRTALEYAKLKSNSHVICLFPIAHRRINEVMKIINEYSNIFYKSTIELNNIGQLGLMKEIYFVEGWANEEGIKRKGDQCFRGESKTTFVLIDADNLETVKEMKTKIRELFNVGNHSVHISDYHSDAIRIAKTVFNDNSIHFLNNRKNVLFPNYNKLMTAVKPDDNKVITGSSVLSLYGLRDCKDLDLIYYDNPPADSHNQYLETHYKLTLDDIVNNPLYHLYYQGFKYVSLNVIKNMKTIRNEPKDVIDVQLIEKVEG